MDAGGREPLTPRRKWTAISLATLLLLVAYWAIVLAFIASRADNGPDPGPPLALGLALAPFVFVLLAFLSQHDHPPGAVLKAMGLALVVAIPVSAFAQDIVTGLVAGFGAGGIVALRTEPGASWKFRAGAVFLVAVYVLVLLRIIPEAALLFGPLLPLPALGIADAYGAYRLERAAGAAHSEAVG